MKERKSKMSELVRIDEYDVVGHDFSGDVRLYTPEQAANSSPSLMVTAAALLPTLTREQLAVIVALFEQACPHCHEQTKPCYCSNDD
jgi:hypothetical protein